MGGLAMRRIAAVPGFVALGLAVTALGGCGGMTPGQMLTALAPPLPPGTPQSEPFSVPQSEPSLAPGSPPAMAQSAPSAPPRPAPVIQATAAASPAAWDAISCRIVAWQPDQPSDACLRAIASERARLAAVPPAGKAEPQ